MRFGMMAAAAAFVMAAPASAAVQVTGFSLYTSDLQRIGAPTDIPFGFTPEVGGGTRQGIFFEPIPVDTSADFSTTAFGGLFGTPFAFYNIRYTAALDRLEIFSGDIAFNEGQDDFFGVIDNFSDVPNRIGVDFRVSLASAPGGYWTSNGLFAGVPEPATWGMMIGGFGMVGAASRRRARVAYA